jgi:hypothetical protein
LSRRVVVNLPRLRIPWTPNSLGRDVFVHLTLHRPPERALSPAQRKRLQNLSISSKISFVGYNTMRR